MMATRVALTVKDFNYYIGHAYVSLSRLHINMLANPPRNIRLTAPRRTEMRRMMQQFRSNAAPPRRGEAPSGYIVDISRDDAPGDSTRAIVNRGSGGGGGGEPGEGERGTKGEEGKPGGGEGVERGKKGGEGERGGGERGKKEEECGGGASVDGEKGKGGATSAGVPPGTSGDSGSSKRGPMSIPPGFAGGPNHQYKSGIPSLGQLLPGIGYEAS